MDDFSDEGQQQKEISRNSRDEDESENLSEEVNENL